MPCEPRTNVEAPPNEHEAHRSTTRPLDGMIVLDLGQVYQEPYCAVLLGFLGARVIKIELTAGDVIRRRMSAGRDPYQFLMLNSNKESVVLDLKRQEGKDLLLELVDKADVLVENY